MSDKEASSPAQPVASWVAFMITGVLALLLGVIAIAGPHVVTFAINFLLGGLLVVIGVGEIIRAYQNREREGWWWALVLGLLYLLGGAFLLFDPRGGVLALTLVLTIAFVVKGITTIIYAFGLRPLANWGWLALSGVASIVVGLLIWSGWPDSAMWAIGLLIGIEFVLFGWSLIMIGLAARAAR